MRPRSSTSRRAARITQWFSDHWPEDLAWPVDIPRPAPSPDSPAARPPEPVADPLAVVEKELARVHEAMDAQDWAAYARHEAAMFRAARTLGDNHRIKSVKALCVALGVRRSVVDDVVKRFRDGRDGGTPRRGTDSDKVLDQLVASGDERFSERRLPEAS